MIRGFISALVSLSSFFAAQAGEIPANTILLADVPGKLASDLKPGTVLDGRIVRILGVPEAADLEGGTLQCTIVKQLLTRAYDTRRNGVWGRLDHWFFDFPTRSLQHGAYLRSATITRRDGVIVSIDATLVETLDQRASEGSAQPERSLTLVVKLERAIALTQAAPLPEPAAAVIRGGSQAHVILAQGLTSSADQPGDEIRAYLLDPIYTGTDLALPSGVVFVGRVAGARPPRRLWRGGRIQLSFTKLVLPRGGVAGISTSVSGLRPSRQLQARLGPEGALLSRNPGMKSAMLEAGSSYVVGKLTDDIFEEGIKAAISNISSGAVAAYARYVGFATGIAWLCGHRGRDVQLPAFSEITITFNRDVNLR